jgi:hypothetical protein
VTTLFQRAAAVVVDPADRARMPQSSPAVRHPAVMGTGIGTQGSDGQLVTINGSTGRVTAADTEDNADDQPPLQLAVA